MTRRPGLALLALGIALLLSACGLAPATLIAAAEALDAAAVPQGSSLLEVTNFCLGDDATVSIYVDGVYRGDVFYDRTFVLPRGYHALEAVGTGRYGSVFTSSIYLEGSRHWTLC